MFLTTATVLCTLDPISMLGATDQGWLPMERTFLAASVLAVSLTTILLWSRLRWALPLVVSAYFVFGFYQAWKLSSTIRSENYAGPAVLVFLVFVDFCPFVAAAVTAAWGREFCERAAHIG